MQARLRFPSFASWILWQSSVQPRCRDFVSQGTDGRPSWDAGFARQGSAFSQRRRKVILYYLPFALALGVYRVSSSMPWWVKKKPPLFLLIWIWVRRCRWIRCVHGCCQPSYQHEDDGSLHVFPLLTLGLYFGSRLTPLIPLTRSSIFSSPLKTWTTYTSARLFVFIEWLILREDRPLWISSTNGDARAYSIAIRATDLPYKPWSTYILYSCDTYLQLISPPARSTCFSDGRHRIWNHQTSIYCTPTVKTTTEELVV